MRVRCLTLVPRQHSAGYPLRWPNTSPQRPLLSLATPACKPLVATPLRRTWSENEPFTSSTAAHLVFLSFSLYCSLTLPPFFLFLFFLALARGLSARCEKRVCTASHRWPTTLSWTRWRAKCLTCRGPFECTIRIARVISCIIIYYIVIP